MLTTMRGIKLATTTILLLFTPTIAWANVGLPMIFLTLPSMTLALPVVAAIEALILSKKLGLRFRSALWAAIRVNLFSTLIGVPLTWFLLVALQLISGGGRPHGIATPLQKFLAATWQSPWLIPYEQQFWWMVPAALTFLLVPFFFASWQSEYLLLRRMFGAESRQAVKSACFQANLLTYILFLLFPLFLLLQSGKL
jgi:hypothetical protein